MAAGRCDARSVRDVYGDGGIEFRRAWRGTARLGRAWLGSARPGKVRQGPKGRKVKR